MNKYYEFNISKFIKEYPENRKRLEYLEGKINRMSEHDENYPAVKDEIAELSEYVSMYLMAYGTLTEKEKIVVDVFYHRHNIDRIGFLKGYLHMEKTAVYDFKTRIDHKLKKFITNY